jgi:hypothetical protein
MKCKNCIHWQGVRGNEWGDCNRVVSHLNPGLFQCHAVNSEGTILEEWSVPFDPHEIKYWDNKDPNFLPRYAEAILNSITHDDIQVETEERRDVVYDKNGGERIDTIKYHYFTTHKEHECYETD